jgi:hypothetical protein
VEPDPSRFPYVLGLLAICFSIAGIVGAVLSYDSALPANVVVVAISLVISALHFYGGWLTSRYKATGLKVLTAYAIAALALAMGSAAMLYLSPTKQAMSPSYAIAAALVSLPWPIAVLFLANSKRATEACRPVVSDG